MAQEDKQDSAEVAALKEQVAKAKAEKELAVAQLEKLEAEKKLAVALTPPDATAQAAAQVAAAKAQAEANKAQADADKAVFDQQKAAADAQAASIAAEQAALKAKFGVVAGTATTTGAVELGEGGGNGEASLLAARSVETIASLIASSVSTAANGKRCIIFAGQSKPSLGRWGAFRVQMAIANDSFARADDQKTQADDIAGPAPPAVPAGGTESVGALITGAGAILDLGSKLGSYFQSDYKTYGATVAGSDDDLLAVSVAGFLEDSWYPAKWLPQNAGDSIAALLKPLAKLRDDSGPKLKSARDGSARFKANAERATDPRAKEQLSTIAAAYDRAVEAYTAAQKRYDELLAALASVTDGVPLAVHIMDEKTLSDEIDAGSLLLFVRLNTPIGGRYTKKNLWTFFGGMPFFVSGGAIASYTLVIGNTGSIKDAGQFTAHSGYDKIQKVAEEFKRAAAPQSNYLDGKRDLLFDLRRDGVLTEDQFEALKGKL